MHSVNAPFLVPGKHPHLLPVHRKHPHLLPVRGGDVRDESAAGQHQEGSVRGLSSSSVCPTVSFRDTWNLTKGGIMLVVGKLHVLPGFHESLSPKAS